MFENHAGLKALFALWVAILFCSSTHGQESCTFGITTTSVPSIGGGVDAMATFEGGAGTQLVIAGSLESAGGVPANHIAAWDGKSWSALGDGLNDRVLELIVFPNGDRRMLIAGGHFTEAGGAPAAHVARWDGASWLPLGDGLPDTVFTLGVFQTDTGPMLLAATSASKLYKWDGTLWTILAEFDNWVFALEQFGSDLYVGGAFTTINGQEASRFVRWDGSTWSEVGQGTNAGVGDLIVFDDGSGSSLYVSGGFTEAGGQPADHIARWSGTSWSYLPDDGLAESGMGAFAVFDDKVSKGPSLYVASSVPT